MKKEFPAIYALASKIIAIPAVSIITILFISKAITFPPSNIFSMSITVFGVTVALSGVCFSMVSSAPDHTKDIKFAGEKFLHSSILLIQAIILIYARNALVHSTHINQYVMAKNIIYRIFQLVIMIISTTSAFTWLQGFSAINDVLWKRWKLRIENPEKRNN